MATMPLAQTPAALTPTKSLQLVPTNAPRASEDLVGSLRARLQLVEDELQRMAGLKKERLMLRRMMRAADAAQPRAKVLPLRKIK